MLYTYEGNKIHSVRKWRCISAGEQLNHIHQGTKSARLISVYKRSFNASPVCAAFPCNPLVYFGFHGISMTSSAGEKFDPFAFVNHFRYVASFLLGIVLQGNCSRTHFSWKFTTKPSALNYRKNSHTRRLQKCSSRPEISFTTTMAYHLPQHDFFFLSSSNFRFNTLCICQSSWSCSALERRNGLKVYKVCHLSEFSKRERGYISLFLRQF